MDDWLKNRPILQLILNGAISLICLLIMFFVATSSNRSTELSQDLETLKLEKAPYEYVDKKYDEHVTIDERQDEKIETMRIEWRADHKEILNLIRSQHQPK